MVRLAATMGDDGWKQTLLEIATGPPPPHWERIANGAGGTILFGVTRHGEIVGVPITGRREPTVDVSNVAKDWVRPRPKCHYSVVPLEEIARTVPPEEGADRGVVVLRVEAGTNRPYGVGDPLAVYVRHSSTSAPASHAEIQGLARSEEMPGRRAFW